MRPQVVAHPFNDVSELEPLQQLRRDAAPAVHEPEQVASDQSGAVTPSAKSRATSAQYRPMARASSAMQPLPNEDTRSAVGSPHFAELQGRLDRGRGLRVAQLVL